MSTATPSHARIRPAVAADLGGIVAIYNHYIEHTAITFDLGPTTVPARTPWFAQFGPSGRHRLFVAERDELIIGYAGSHRFRDKAAYDTTVETTIYLAPGHGGAGLGTALYETLFAAIDSEDVCSMIAGITLPNPASLALHARFGFVSTGVMHRVGRKHGQLWDVAWYERLVGA